MKEKFPVIVILNDVRSSHNVGSIFRTSDALGVNKIYLAGYTPAPEDKFGRENKEISKVALGAEKTLDWEVVKDTVTLIQTLKVQNTSIVAVEQDSKSEDYKKYKIIGPTVFIFGNEVDGLPKNIISLCHSIVEIPMSGHKESLNVSVAFGIVMARILDC